MKYSFPLITIICFSGLFFGMPACLVQTPTISDICSDSPSGGCDACVREYLLIAGTNFTDASRVVAEYSGDGSKIELDVDRINSTSEKLQAILPSDQCMPAGKYNFIIVNGSNESTPFLYTLILCDTDCDGKDDGRDNCPEAANPDQLDTDGDKIGDLCDSCTDTDKDGYGNPGFDENLCAMDNCPAVANNDQADQDGDKAGDACDPCPADNPDDPDNDTVCQSRDNCPNKANTDQTDSDNDAIGDACDTCPYDPKNDADGDGVCGDVDNCPNLSNSDQKDKDADEIGDVCDNCAVTFNPDQKNIDDDKIGDVCDNCPLDPQNDIDADNICGNIDNCPNNKNSNQVDCDGDRLGDICDNDNSSCAPMVFVQAGKFWRGSCNESTTPSCQAGSPGYVLSSSPDSMASYETPIRQIYLDAYYIDTFEVSVKHFEMCVNAGACNDSNFKTKSYDSYCNYGYSDRGNHPMNCLNWDGANEYCEFVGKRLPTEAEWEKAARGENGRKYPWGDQNPDCTYANFYYNANHCVGTTSPVGSYPKGKSAYGLYDMAGNVWEWVYDWWAADYYNKDFSSPDYSPDINPQGPSNGTNRGIRGGGWRSDVISWFRSANRSMFSNPSSFGSTVGFRCAAGQ